MLRLQQKSKTKRQTDRQTDRQNEKERNIFYERLGKGK